MFWEILHPVWSILLCFIQALICRHRLLSFFKEFMNSSHFIKGTKAANNIMNLLIFLSFTSLSFSMQQSFVWSSQMIKWYMKRMISKRGLVLLVAYHLNRQRQTPAPLTTLPKKAYFDANYPDFKNSPIHKDLKCLLKPICFGMQWPDSMTVRSW